jgi:hypothetical protein
MHLNQPGGARWHVGASGNSCVDKPMNASREQSRSMSALAIWRSLTSRRRLRDGGLFTGLHLQGVVRLLMHALEESGVTGVAADGVEEWVHADESHVEAVVIERMLEGVEGVLEFVDAKIIDADLVSDAGVG